ncbi:MAG TPA: ATP-binding protein [Solirubrobacteraceae bacterium]
MKRREAIAGLIIGAMIVLALMAVFAIQLADNQSKSKSDIQARVHQNSLLAGALIVSLFQSVQRQVPAQAKLYGARHPSDALLDGNVANNTYLALVRPSGAVIAHSRGFNAQAQMNLKRSATLKLLRAGHRWALGNVLPYGRTGVINLGVVLPTRSGPRYLLTGFAPGVLSLFLEGELKQIPGVRGAHNYLLDGAGVVIASTNASRPPGYVFHTPAQLSVLHRDQGEVNGHYFDQVRLMNSTWRIVLAAPDSGLFASVSGSRKWLPWLIFIAFGIVALVALVLARRALRDSDRVRESNAQLGEANTKLEGVNFELADTNQALADTNQALADTNQALADTNQALADSNRALEVTNAELETRAVELSRSNNELDQFASIASHDLQEPLRKVRTFTERITETEGEHLSERGQDYLRRANASAERMQKLIEDLLKFSRVATQGRPFAAVDLSQIATDVLEDLHDSIQRAGAEIHVGALPTIDGDAHQMRQLIQNLVSNAVKFNREGVTPQIEISAKQEDGFVKLEVQDNGIGFDPQYSRRIFRVFERLHGRGTYPGTGIGLALCRKIAERHGGTVVADSVPGEGSTFTVTLRDRHPSAATDNAAGDGRESPPATDKEPYVSV